MLNSRTGRTGASSVGLFETEAFSTLRQAWDNAIRIDSLRKNH